MLVRAAVVHLDEQQPLPFAPVLDVDVGDVGGGAPLGAAADEDADAVDLHLVDVAGGVVVRGGVDHGDRRFADAVEFGVGHGGSLGGWSGVGGVGGGVEREKGVGDGREEVGGDEAGVLQQRELVAGGRRVDCVEQLLVLGVVAGPTGTPRR